MARSLPSFGVPVLSLVLVATAACSDSTISFEATGPAPLTAGIGVRTTFGVEPATLRPELLPGSCGAHSPFGVRLGISVRGDADLIVRALRFSYSDRLGRQSAPDVIPVPSNSAPSPLLPGPPPSNPVTIPTTAALPTASPIPIPGGTTINGVLVRGGAHERFDYYLRFNCLVLSEGILVVIIETADRHGRFDTSELKVRLGP